MKIVALEEHSVNEAIVHAWSQLDPNLRDVAQSGSSSGELSERLRDVGRGRLAAMDANGIDVAVLSITAPGVQSLAAADAPVLAREANDWLAAAVATHPDRFQAFATLPTPVPHEAANELERAVATLGFNGAMLFGRTRDRNLDHADNWPIFEAASALRAPLYVHPQSPQPSVRAAYYAGFGDEVDASFATHGVGWHYETGVQLLRLILAGVFDRFPDLQIIVGHWGELVLFYLERIESLAKTAKLPRSILEYVRANVYVTPSGIFSERYARWAIEVAGADRLLFATDYPYVPGSLAGAKDFLQDALSSEDRARIASGNWDALCARIKR